MITIYSVDSEGRLFTDPLSRFYVDASLLQEKKTAYVMEQIAWKLGFDSFNSLRCMTRSFGVTEDIMMDWILSGQIADKLRTLR